jgi:hypothetical protein
MSGKRYKPVGHLKLVRTAHTAEALKQPAPFEAVPWFDDAPLDAWGGLERVGEILKQGPRTRIDETRGSQIRKT